MKFLGLISGGKDSIFNIIQCIKNGHELVALGNLYPVGTDELDSFMYQSVGHEIIGLIGQALEKPLYRRPIKGKPKVLDLEYGETIDEEDEVEDLFELLKEIKEKHPEIEGISSGAINSTYQKNRVENLCERLGMTSLAYLWEWEQADLLNAMVDGGMDAILIKVASFGLGKKHLGKSLKELREYLLGMQEKYGNHCCGEGGEFESLTLDCPIYKKRIKIVESEIIMTQEDNVQEIGYLKIKEAVLVEKEAEEEEMHEDGDEDIGEDGN